jgi:hypothetical protein
VDSGRSSQRRAIEDRVLVVAGAAGVAIFGALINWPSGMDAEVAGGLVFLVGTVLGVEWFVEQSNERQRERELRERWAGLGGVPFRGLSGPVGDIVDGLAWLLTADHPFERPAGVSGTHEQRLFAALERAHLEPTRIPSGDQQRLFEERLRALLADEDWCGLAVSVIDLLKWRYRERIGIWAGPMLEHPDVARVLSRMTLLDDRIGELQAPLRELGNFPHENRNGDPDAAAGRWFTLLAECVSLREDLQRAALVGDYSQEWATRSLAGFARHRHWARPDDSATMDARAAWAMAPLGADASAWQDRRERVLATPLADTPQEWRGDEPSS